MNKSEIQQFLAQIKGNTYRIEGEKVKVESTSINPTNGRVLITTNKWSRFWQKGNTGFTKLFTEPVKPGAYIQTVVQREPDVDKKALPTVQRILTKPEIAQVKVAVTRETIQPRSQQPQPATLQNAFTADNPKQHTYIYKRILDIMKIRGYSIQELANQMQVDYGCLWSTISTSNKTIKLSRLQELAVGLQVSLPYLVSSEPITPESIELHTVNYRQHA